MTDDVLREPVGVLGVGVEGRATISHLMSRGVRAITALDRAEVEGLPPSVGSVFGDGYDLHLERFATIFRSPGIRPDHPSLRAAAMSGARVTSAMSYFLERCPAPVIGVTGTLGKGTCSSLIAMLLEASGFTIHLGGNIGKSPLEFLDKVRPEDRVVLEISSFQAMDLTASAHICVVLKTTSEHLDWHTDVEEYLKAKSRMLGFQTENDVVVFNADVEGSRKVAEVSAGRALGYSLLKPVPEGLHVDGERFVLERRGERATLPLTRQDIRLMGDFNLENIAAALLAAIEAGADPRSACAAAARFEGLPHRMELVATIGSVRFVNDSYATRPEATIGAINCFRDTRLALIVGGSEKYADFSELARCIAAHPTIEYVGLIGHTAERLQRAILSLGTPRFQESIHGDLKSAVLAAADSVRDGGVVLLSPACASFGLFLNYKARGEAFRALAKSLS